MTFLPYIVLGVWGLACAWCGYAVQLVLFGMNVAFGVGLAMAYVVIGLGLQFTSGNALMLYASAILFALGCFGVGWLMGRFRRRLQETRIEE